MFYGLEDAIALYHQSLTYGMQIHLFPAKLNPNDFYLSFFHPIQQQNTIPLEQLLRK
ncbi:hypothetical protein [Scytonema sp. NUACC21]